jgi:hypothetical protein
MEIVTGFGKRKRQMRNDRVEEEMLFLKKLLENTAEQYEYDFCHPDVIAVSQRLDQLIIRYLNEHLVPKTH